MSKSKRMALNIFLLKEPDDKSKKLIEEKDYLQKVTTSTGKAKLTSTTAILVGDHGKYGTLYIKKPLTESVPDWVDFFVSDLPNGDELKKLKNKSTSALLIKEVSGRQFALAFGHGRHLLDLSCIEYRFGIKVALNIIEPESISSIDKHTFDASPRITKTQTIKPSALSDYGINTEQDLLKGVVGAVKKEYIDDFGSMVAGIDSLKISLDLSLDKLTEILIKSLSRYSSKDYLKVENSRAGAFAWVDNLQAVSDPSIKRKLDDELWNRFEKNNFENMFLAIPELIDWEKVSGFAYTESQSKNPDLLVNYLDIRELRASIRSGANIDTLKNRQIFMAMNSTGYIKKFSLFRCFYTELKILGDAFLYILTAGNWFKVEPSFEQQVDSHFRKIPVMKFSYPFIEYDHEGEGKYNDEVAGAVTKEYLLLDRKLIQFGGSHSSIEVCDLYKTKPVNGDLGELVHVKRGRDSSSLSHLFAQGLVSSTLLASETDFITEVNKQILAQGGIVLPSKMPTDQYDIVFAIIDGAAGTPLEIPFFSKVNLQNCARSIRAFKFGIKFLHIPESAIYLKKKEVSRIAKKAAKKSSVSVGGSSTAP